MSLSLTCLADQQFTNEEIQMSNRQMENYLMSLVIKEIPKWALKKKSLAKDKNK